MMASGEEAAELGDADSGLMWKPHKIEVIIINIKKNIEVVVNIIIINIKNNIEVTGKQPEMQNAPIIQIW